MINGKYRRQGAFLYALSAIMTRCENVLSLNDFIRMGSGIIVTEPEDGAVDFSPENVLKSTFFDLIDSVDPA